MFSRKKSSRLQPSEYLARFEALRHRWPDGYADHATSLQEALVIAVGVLHAIFDRNGGNGWDEDAHGEHLELLREHLGAFEGFTRDEQDRIAWALAEILACGSELEREGESARDATGALDVLKARVVDWIVAHPEAIPIGNEDDDYIGHD